MTSFNVRTNARRELVEITDNVNEIVRTSRTDAGICIVYCPHTTAAITINENADPDVVHDMLLWMGKTIPKEQAGFRHGEGNSDSHIQCALVGPSQTLIVEGGKLVFGRWQGVYLCEFDGPRSRTVHVQIMAKHTT